MELVLSLIWLGAVATLILRAISQRGLLPEVEPVARFEDSPGIAVVVPMRDEARNVGACLSALVAQRYPPGRLRIIVVDDHSRDETASIAADIARRHPSLEILSSPALPPGWIGKSHACWIGAGAAPPDSEWLCFMDADVRAAPLLMTSAIAMASDGRFDLLSLMPRQELLSFAERIVMPCGLYLMAFRQNIGRIQASDSPDATATGQFILVRRSAYLESGGHAAVRTDVCEDVALARLIKRAGWRVILAGGDRLLSARMYDGWRSLWIGVSKNLVDMLGGPVATVVTAVVGVVLAWSAVALPLVDAIGCAHGRDHACLALAAALPASVSAFGLHIAGAAFFRIPLWCGLLFPVGYTAGAMMALDSVRRRMTGRVSWKGRTYP